MTIETKDYPANEDVIVWGAGTMTGSCCALCSSFLLAVDGRAVCSDCDGEITVHGPAVLKHESIRVVDSARFHLPYQHDQPISCGQAIPMFYDRSMKRWRVRES